MCSSATMAKIGDLPVELVNFITDYLCRAGDLAALARTNHRFHDAVDPILYKFAREYVPNSVSWHPLRWASQYGKTGTLNKALAAGIDVNMAFVHVDSMSFHDWDKFREREESAGSTPLEGSQEWEPHEDDTDTDDWATSTSTHDDRMPPEYLASNRLARGLRFSDMADDEFAWNGFDDFDAMDEFLDGPEDNSMAGGDFMSEIDSLAEAAAVAAFQNGHVPWSDDEMDDDGDMDDDDGTGLDEDENGHEGAPRRHADRRRDPESFWALHIAARAGQDDVVEILLDHGASIDICSHQMGRPVHLLSRDCPEQHGTLLSPADIGYSPLHLAICYFQESTARLLLSRGASPRLSEPHRKDAFTALHAASAVGEVGLCKYILDGGFAELDALDHTGLTPFYYACRSGRWDSTVSYLLEKGADIDFLIRQYDRRYADEGGEFSTTLYEACVYGYCTEAIKLINLGADVNKGVFGLDKQYRSPLHAVCEPPTQFLGPRRHPALSSTPAPVNDIEEQRVELVELMLRSGADLEAKTCPQRESPLQLAATHCDVAALRVLLAEGADVQSQK